MFHNMEYGSAQLSLTEAKGLVRLTWYKLV
jgi:hypothetical protein